MTFAFCFPGQGSQSVGMMNGFAGDKTIRDTFTEAADLLGEDFWGLVDHGPAEALNKTRVTQPLMLTAGIAVYRAWLLRTGLKPGVVAGHSLGEYTALVAAEALSFKDALQLTRFRAEAMQSAVKDGEGGMAAILGLDDEGVEAACQAAAEGDVLQAANFNAPGQVVIAGTRQAIERGIEAAKARGAKRAILLPMSVPSHCDLMREAADALYGELTKMAIQSPTIPVIHNCDVECHASPEAIRQALKTQLFQPVRWVGVVKRMADDGYTLLGEAGPGKVLAPLTKRIDERITGMALNDWAGVEALEARLNGEAA